jgi:hypothetical protein
MKWNSPFTVAVAAITSVAPTLVGCKTRPESVAIDREMPPQCMLASMSNEERSVHLRRLELLRAASHLESKKADGFVFSVDLKKMPNAELEGWMQNEQRCCSFLRMSKTADTNLSRAEIAVTCPAEMRDAVIQTFGLR